jgi:hypothetical protein
MKKNILIVIIVISFLTVLLLGCFEEEYQEDKDKFVGFWKADPDFSKKSFTFFKNGTCYINNYDPPLLGNYTVNETENILRIHQFSGSIDYEYKYRFDYTDDEMTLIDQKNFETYTFYRQ